MNEFIARANIEHLKACLTEELSHAERQTVERLLAEEERKLALAQAQRQSKQNAR